VRRDYARASIADVIFIGHVRRDVELLVGALAVGPAVSSELLQEVSARVRAASPAPWTPYLAGERGSAGSSMIAITGDSHEPDLYLWIDEDPASDADYAFVAEARNLLPDLLNEAKQMSIRTGGMADEG
jgi:hypothetical protein